MSSENPIIVGTNGHINGNGSAAGAPAPATNGSASASRGVSGAAPRAGESSNVGTFGVKSGLAQMLKGGVIMDVSNVEQARIAEEAGACAVMALERIPADIRKAGGVARMSDPAMINSIIEAVSIPVMAKCRIGHIVSDARGKPDCRFLCEQYSHTPNSPRIKVEAQILQSLGVDYCDESEVLTAADPALHINKHNFKVPFVCGAKNLGEALRRISEGAAMIRTKGEAGTGNVVEAVRHQRQIQAEIKRAAGMSDEELYAFAKELQAPFHLLKETARLKRLPVVNL